jgi:hypothetical protein
MLVFFVPSFLSPLGEHDLSIKSSLQKHTHTFKKGTCVVFITFISQLPGLGLTGRNAL